MNWTGRKAGPRETRPLRLRRRSLVGGPLDAPAPRGDFQGTGASRADRGAPAKPDGDGAALARGSRGAGAAGGVDGGSRGGSGAAFLPVARGPRSVYRMGSRSRRGCQTL